MENSQIQNPDGKANNLMSDNSGNPAEEMELEPRVPTAADTLTLDAEAQLQLFLSIEASFNYFPPFLLSFRTLLPPALHVDLPIPRRLHPSFSFLGVYFQNSAISWRLHSLS